MSVDPLIALALLLGAFAAGWFARGAGLARAAADAPVDAPGEEPDAVPDAHVALREEPEPQPEPRPAPAPDPAELRAAVDAGARHLAAAVDAWLDDRGGPSADGRRALEGLDRSLEALAGAPSGPAADAVAALRDARLILDAYAGGAPLDAAASRRLDAHEQTLEEARARLGT